MPVNPHAVCVDEDTLEAVAEMTRHLIARQCASFNIHFLVKVVVFASMLALHVLVAWHTATDLTDALWYCVQSLGVYVVAYGVALALAHRYLVTLRAKFSTGYLFLLLSYRPLTEPTREQLDHLVRFSVPQHWIGTTYADWDELEDHCVELAATICTLWKTQQLYRMLRKAS